MSVVERFLLVCVLALAPFAFGNEEAKVEVKGVTTQPAPATKELPPPDDPYAPVMVVEGGLVVSFGEAEKGDTKRVRFVIRNDGAGVLKIERTDTDCGCLAPEISRGELRKGERGTIEVTVTTSIIEGEAQDKHIIVHTNDSRYPHGLQLEVEGKVVSTIGVRPARVVFDAVRADSAAVRILEIYDKRDFGLKIEELTTTANAPLEVRYEEAQVTIRQKREKTKKDAEAQEENKKEEKDEFEEKTYPGYRIEVRLAENARVGRLEEALWVRTNYERRERFPIAVMGSLIGDFSYKPMGSMTLGSVGVGKTSRRYPIVIKKEAEGFAVSRAEATDPALEIELERDADETRVWISAKGGGKPGRHRAGVLVYREGKEEPIIALPVSWRVRGKGLAPLSGPEEPPG